MEENQNIPEEFRTIAGDLFGKKKRKKSINSKDKGNRGERKAITRLSEWVGVPFHRTPGSGGLRWARDARIAGDIVSGQDVYYPFVNEVKFYAKLGVTPILKPSSIIFKFWSQVVNDCARIGDALPILFCRETGMPAVEFFVFVQPAISKILTDFDVPVISQGTSKDGYPVVGFMFSDIVKIPYNEFIVKVKIVIADIFG